MPPQRASMGPCSCVSEARSTPRHASRLPPALEAYQADAHWSAGTMACGNGECNLGNETMLPSPALAGDDPARGQGTCRPSSSALSSVRGTPYLPTYSYLLVRGRVTTDHLALSNTAPCFACWQRFACWQCFAVRASCIALAANIPVRSKKYHHHPPGSPCYEYSPPWLYGTRT